MNVLAIVGPGDTEQFADSLADHLASRGTVGRVRGDDTARDSGKREATPGSLPDGNLYRTANLSDDGTWTATGNSATLDDVLDRFAPDCDFVIVEGFDDIDLPKVVVGDDESGRNDVLVSGSSPADIDMDELLEALAARDPYETLESLVARVKESTEETFAGAIATFTGRVRAKDHADDEYTEYLEFERYDGIAEEKIQRIRDELESRDGVFEVLLHHKTGVVEAGEDIVFVVVLAGHRTEAFQTVEDGINRLKEEVPLFKKEVTVDDEYWAHTGTRE